jgi:hypothetical protein
MPAAGHETKWLPVDNCGNSWNLEIRPLRPLNGFQIALKELYFYSRVLADRCDDEAHGKVMSSVEGEKRSVLKPKYWCCSAVTNGAWDIYM